MPLLRHPTGHEQNVPEAAVPFFPEWEVVEGTSTLPPKSGRGSSDDAWRTYAGNNGVEVADDAKRDDIIAALNEAGVPTE